jgi:hypothetical protein
VLSFVAGVTATQVAVLTDPPLHELDPRRHWPTPAPAAPPPGAPPELWREAAPSGRPGQVLVARPDREERPHRRTLLLDPWRASALPGGEHLGLQASSWGSGRPAVLTFDAPPPGSVGVRLRLEGAYRWEPAVAWAEVPAPAAGRDVPLAGAALAWPGGRLDLVAWEPRPTHSLLVARPAQGIGTGGWPAWLPDLRLVLGAASRGLACAPCDDGTFVFTVPAEDVPGPTVRLGVRAVGRRLAPAELDLPFEPPAAAAPRT